jgi:hypothetical protein
MLDGSLRPFRLSINGTLPDFLTAESLDKNILLIEKRFKRSLLLFAWLGERRPSPQYGYRSRPPHHWDYSPAADNFKWNLVKVKLKTIIPQKLTMSTKKTLFSISLQSNTANACSIRDINSVSKV